MSGPLFTYNTNVPQASQTIKSTQSPILNNFLAINELISVNHVGFSDSENFGKHNFTTLPAQSVDPSTGTNEMALYSKLTPGGAHDLEIYYRYPNNGTIEQLSGSSSGGSGPYTNGWTYLPGGGGLLLKWGQATGIVTGTNNVTFATGGSIPAFTTSIYNVQYTPAMSYTNSTPSAYISASSITGFTLVAPNTVSSTIFWMAIGV